LGATISKVIGNFRKSAEEIFRDIGKFFDAITREWLISVLSFEFSRPDHEFSPISPRMFKRRTAWSRHPFGLGVHICRTDYGAVVNRAALTGRNFPPSHSPHDIVSLRPCRNEEGLVKLIADG